jgi:hypothetical protein
LRRTLSATEMPRSRPFSSLPQRLSRGQVHRLKAIKQAWCGRAKFDLLGRMSFKKAVQTRPGGVPTSPRRDRHEGMQVAPGDVDCRPRVPEGGAQVGTVPVGVP